MTPQFNIQRIGNFIYRDITLLKGTIITTLSVAGGLLFIFFLFGLRKDHLLTPDEFVSIFTKFYIIIGLLLTFSIFKEAQNKKANHFYFALPVSAYEKTVAIWLTTSILYTIVFTVFAYLVGQLAIITGSVLSETNFHFLSIFSESYWELINGYFFIQPLFLLGAITFSKNRIGKTLLLTMFIIFGLFMFNFILFAILNYDIYDFFSEEQDTNACSLALEDFSPMGRWLFGIVLGPVMMIAAYFKIIEKEV